MIASARCVTVVSTRRRKSRHARAAEANERWRPLKFAELPLYRAIAKAYARVESPRSASWFIHTPRELYALIVAEMNDFSLGVPWPLSAVLDAWDRYGKGASVGEGGLTKNDLIVQISESSGDRCFYADRGLGACDEDVDLDRLLPGSCGGVYSIANCVLSCSRHNRQRQDKPIEKFLFPDSVR